MEPATLPSIVGQLDAPLGSVTRPSWRGRLHAYGLLAFPPLLAVMFGLASGTRARVAIVIYAVGLCSMFFVSATYHRWVHTLRARAYWRRADHATIYVTIAGSFTPICLLAVPAGLGIPLLAVMWAGGLAGMAMKITDWRHARIVGGVMYIALGWVGAIAIPAIWQRVGVVPAVLVLVGGLFYTVGALWLNREWPKLRPAVFSYHEVWHACTVIAAGAQLAAVWIIAT